MITKATGLTSAGCVVCAVLVQAVFLSSLHAAGRASWHHADSPYRAEFKVIHKPSHKDAGIAVAVPVCGLGSKDGRDLYAYDQSGNQLRVCLLGEGADNTVLALVKGTSACTMVYAYFGSGGRAPVVEKGFLPGLTVDVRNLPKGPAQNWNDVEALLGKSKTLGKRFVDKIELGYNPVDSSDSCILVFDGYLNVPKQGTYTYMIVTDDAGYLLIDDALLLARDGRHWARDAVRGECRKDIVLTPGPHSVRLVVVDFGGTLMALLGRWSSGRDKAVLPADAFIQSGRTRLTNIEARYRDAAMPIFRYELRSYMSYNGAQYTEVFFEAVNGEQSLWRFEDGMQTKGVNCTRILPGLSTRGVACTQGRTTAQAHVQINEIPPKVLSLSDRASFERYSKLILGQNLGDLDPTTLRGYVTYLGYRPLNDDLVPVCEAILGSKDASDAMRTDAALELGRAGAKTQPDKARKAYRALVGEKPSRVWLGYCREASEFALYRVRDFDWAEEIIELMKRHVDKGDKVVTELLLDLELQRGNEEEARKYLEALLSGRDLGEKQRFSVVQGNALRQRYHDLLLSGFLKEARDVLHEWSSTSPSDRTNGSLSLARARLWHTIGWLDGALGELDGAILLDPLLPNLPDIELERAKVIAEAGETKRANELFLKIVNEYPNHPAADEAKGLMR